jgi:hypothetical protein
MESMTGRELDALEVAAGQIVALYLPRELSPEMFKGQLIGRVASMSCRLAADASRLTSSPSVLSG